jgi:hypothetical protein
VGISFNDFKSMYCDVILTHFWLQSQALPVRGGWYRAHGVATVEQQRTHETAVAITEPRRLIGDQKQRIGLGGTDMVG